jgi:DNA-binding NarL/FixJ family response regulator
MDDRQDSIRILIAEPQTMFRVGLRKRLEREPGMKVVGEAAGGREAYRLAAELRPDILILDMALRELPEMATLTGSPGCRTILLIKAGDAGALHDPFPTGVYGYVLREAEIDSLIDAVHCVMRGEYWIGTAAVSDRACAFQQMAEPAGKEPRRKGTFDLTGREMEILSEVVRGYSNKAIAKKFSISEDTVKHHLTHIFDKLGVYNRLELALFAIHHGLISGTPLSEPRDT